VLFALKHDDARLVKRVLAGEREAYGALVRHYLPAVHAVGRAQTGSFAEAEDIAQEAFLAAYTALDTLREPGKFGPWLLRIARNKANDWLTKRAREKRLNAGLEDAAEPFEDAARELEVREMRAMLRRRVEELDEDFREVLFMHYFAGVKTREMAQLLEISHEAVRKRLQRAREALGKQLLDELGRDRDSEKALEKRALTIIGAVAGASAGWQRASAETGSAASAGAGSAGTAAATSGMTIGGLQMLMGFLSSKAGIVLVAAVAVAGGLVGVVSLQNGEDAIPPTNRPALAAQPAEQEGITDSAAPLPQRQRMASTVEAGEPKAAAQSAAVKQPTGPYGIAGKVDKPGATVRLERVDIYGYECEPEDAVVMSTTADKDGAFLFEDIPSGWYVVEAYTVDAFIAARARPDTYSPEPYLDVVLLPGAPVRGRVADESGRPVSGAALYVQAYDKEPGDLPLPETTAARMVTDGEGRFASIPLWPGQWKFLVRAEGYESLLSEFIGAGSEDVELTLAKGRAIAGQVVDHASRTPLAKIRVRVESKILKRDQFYATSDDGGAFSVAGLRAGEYTAVADDPEWISSGGPVAFNMKDGEEAPALEVPVMPGALVMGRITDADSGEGLAGVKIYTYPEPQEIVRHREAFTDATGGYVLTGLPSGSYAVRWSPVEGYSRPYNEKNAKELQVVAGQTVSGVDFSLSHGIRLTGKVVDAEGQPVPRAKINCVIGQDYRDYVGADKTGHFLLAGLPPTDRLEVIARKHDRISAPVGPLTVSLEGNEPLTIPLGPAGAIKGTARDAAGRPLPKAEVYVEHQEARQLGWDSERTNNAGEFSFSGLLPGPTTVSVIPRNTDLNARTEYKDIVVPAGGTVENLELIYQPPGDPSQTGVIAGRVADKTGKPIERAEVHIFRQTREVATGADGTFEITGLPDGTHELQVWHPQYSVAYVKDVAAGTRNVFVTLLGLTEVHGTVIDAVTKQPITTFYAYERDDELSRITGQMKEDAQRFQDEEGRFKLECIHVRDSFIYTWADGYTWQKTRISVTSDQEPLTGVVIAMKRGAIIEGEVVDPGGAPAPGAMLFTGALPHTVQRGERNVGYADAQGRFRLDTVEQSVRCISAAKPGYGPGFTLVSPVGGQTQRVTIALTGGGVLKGMVNTDNIPGEPYHIGVDVRHPFEPALGESGVKVNPDGTYAIADLAPGEILVRGMAWFSTADGQNAHYAAYKRALIEAGNETVVDFDFSQGTASVEGLVTIDGEKPARGWVTLGKQWHAGGRLDESGRYRLDGLQAGEVVLLIEANAGEAPSRRRLETIQVKAGENRRYDVDLTGAASVKGTVTGAAPEMRVSVYLLQGRHTWPSVPWNVSDYAMEFLIKGVDVNEDGTFSMSSFDAGEYTLCATALIPSGGGIGSEADCVAMPCAMAYITLEEGGETVVNLQLR